MFLSLVLGNDRNPWYRATTLGTAATLGVLYPLGDLGVPQRLSDWLKSYPNHGNGFQHAHLVRREM